MVERNSNKYEKSINGKPARINYFSGSPNPCVIE